MPNLGEVSLKIKIDTKDITKEVTDGFSKFQKEADGHVITYKIAGDKSSLETALKQLQGMTPEILTKIRLDFNKEYYDKEMAHLKNTAGKTADQIGQNFKTSVENSLSGFSIKDIIGKTMKKGDVFDNNDVTKLKNELSNIINQTKSLSFDKNGLLSLGTVGSRAELEEQIVALNKIKMIFESLSKYNGTKQSIRTTDFGELNISKTLENTKQVLNTQMADAGNIIQKNAQQWMTTLETTFNKEFGGIVNLFNNLQEIINGVFNSTGGGQPGGGVSKELETLQSQIEETTREITELETKLSDLKEKSKQTELLNSGKLSDANRAIGNFASRDKMYLSKDEGDLSDLGKQRVESFKEKVNEYMLLGGKLTDVTSELAKGFIAKFNIQQIFPNNFAQEITDITNQLTQLKIKRDELISQKEILKTTPTTPATIPDEVPSGKNVPGTPSTATLSPTLSVDFKEKLQEQVTAIGSVNATVSGKLSDTFKSDVQTSVDGLGKVDMGVSFSNSQKEGEQAQKIPVDVIATPKLQDNFQSDLQKLIDDTGSYKVSVKADDTKKDDSLPVNVTVANGEDFRTNLKQVAEGDAGLDVKVNPVLAPDFELTINKAVLKDVTIEGTINGGNLKPASVEVGAGQISNPSGETQGTSAQEEALERVEEGYTEVGQAAVESGEKQKRSLYDVRKAIIETQRAQDELRNAKKHNVDQMFNDAVNDHYINQQQKYSSMNRQQLQKKLQEKLSSTTYDEDQNKALMNREKLYASILVLVEKIEAATKKPISDLVNTDEMKQFLEVRSRIEERIQKSNNFTNQDINLGNTLSQLEAEEKQLLQNASAAEKMEKELLEAAIAIDSLKNKKGVKFDSFVNSYDQYKASGGTRDISEFSNDQKTIEAVKKSYADLARIREFLADTVKTDFAKANPDIDVKQFDALFEKIKTGALNAQQATSLLNAEVQALKANSEKGTGTGTTPIATPETPGTPAKPGAEVGVTPKVDPIGFANEVNKQLGASNAEINVVPKVDPVVFANSVTEQLKGQNAVVDVKPNAVNTATDVGTTGMTAETTQAETLRSKIAEVTNAVDAKTNAFRQEEQVVIGTVQREISSLEALDGQLTFVLQTLEKIKNSPIALNITTNEEFFNSESNVKQIIEELKTSLSGIDSNLLNNLKEVLQALNVRESVANNVQRIANAILNLKTNLNNISPSSTDFINSIKELANQKDALQSLATVITATKKQLEEAKQAVQNSGQGASTFNVAIGTDEWNDAIKKAKDYKKVIGEIQKITYNFRRDSDGKYYKSFTFTGEKGKAVEGKNGELLYGHENKDVAVDTSKTATQMDNLIRKFEEAARKAGILYNVGSLRINDDGIITFTSTVEELGDKAVTTKYKIEDLNKALNKDGSLSKNYLNAHSDGKSVKDLSGEYSTEDQNALIRATQDAIEWQEQENEYIEKRNRLIAEGKAQEQEYYRKQRDQQAVQQRWEQHEFDIRQKLKQDELSANKKISDEMDKQNLDQKKKWEAFYKEQQDYVSKQQDTAAIERNKQVYNELTDSIRRYSEVSQRIASGKMLDGDIQEAERLESKISELQKSPILSPSQIEHSERLLVNLYNRLSDLEKKTQSAATSMQQKNKYTLEATKRYEQLLNHSLANMQLDNGAIFKNATVDKSGKAILTFLELVGDKARETTVTLQQVDDAMTEIANGTFNWDANASTSKWRKSTKADIFGSNETAASTNNVQRVIDAYEKLISSEDKYQKLRAKIDKGSATSDQVAEFNRLTLLRQEYNNILRESMVLSKEEHQFYEQSGKAQIEVLKARYQQQKVDSSYTYEAYLDANRVSDSNVAYDEAVRINDALKNTKNLYNDVFAKKQNISGFKDAADRAEKEIDDLNKKLISGNISNIQTGYTDKINKIINNLNNTVAVTTPFSDEEAKQAMLDYANTLNNGNVQIGDFKNNNEKLIVSFQKQRGVMQDVELSWNRVSGAITATEKGTRTVGTTLSKFIDGVKQRFMSLGQYLISFVGFYRIFAQVRKGITVIRELDTALTEMRKVSDETVKSLKDFQDVSFDIAKSVGTTAKQIQNSTADWMRLGESLDEAAKSAEVANILLNVSEFESIDEATESLVSMSAAYKELDKIEIVDKLNLIGNSFAISTDGLATALQNSASALKTANNDIDESIALTTAANAVVQDPDKVGAGLRTIALRITGTEAAKEELQELGEDVGDFVVTTTSKLNEQVKSLTKTAGKDGISLLDDNGNYRSTYEILQDIADVWEKIAEEDLKTGQNRQNALLEMLAGKNRSNILASILQSPDVLRDAYESSMNDSAGSAQKELEKYLDSIEGKIQQFTNEVQEFWYNLINSEFLKDIIDFGTKVMDILGNIVGELGTMPSLLVGAFGISKLKGLITGKGKSGGRAEKFALKYKYATESFSREVCEINLCVLV